MAKTLLSKIWKYSSIIILGWWISYLPDMNKKAVSTYAPVMNCGLGVQTCGVLTIESGMGKGVYGGLVHRVHGLWPEVDPYGNSECIEPQDTAGPVQIFQCYSNDTSNNSLEFENHEWFKHGVCAGVKNSTDYFTQICNLSREPLCLIKNISDFNQIQKILTLSGFEIFQVDTENMQILLSACRNPLTGKWVLSPVSDYPKVCGNLILELDPIYLQ